MPPPRRSLRIQTQNAKSSPASRVADGSRKEQKASRRQPAESIIRRNQIYSRAYLDEEEDDDEKRKDEPSNIQFLRELISSKKRTRDVIDEDTLFQIPNALAIKRPKLSTYELGEKKDPVEHWIQCAYWPDEDEMSRSNSAAPSKRQRSESYTQSSKKGDVPPAHSAASEQQLLLHGINLQDAPAKEKISENSVKLCENLLRQSYELEPRTPFPLSKLSAVLDRLSVRNEARVVRDLTPLLVPSAESLCLSGVAWEDSMLHLVAEDVCAQWSKVKPMGGPMPIPDLTVGLGWSAFDQAELEKLRNYTSLERATLFTYHVYFPFLVCEVKCSDVAISRASRQSGHSGGIAARAVFQLYSSLGPDRSSDLNGEILAFSVAHDHQSVEVYAHFPIYDGQPTFYRYSVLTIALKDDPEKRTKQVRDLILGIYEIFLPKHVARIKAAIANMKTSERAPDSDAASMPPPSASQTQILMKQFEEERELRDQQLEEERREREKRERQLERQLEEAKEIQARQAENVLDLKNQISKQQALLANLLERLPLPVSTANT